jgi:hypothetical protein
MAGEHLGWLALLGTPLALLLLVWAWWRGEQTLIRNALLIGCLAGGLDVVVELTGTTNGLWTYDKSTWFLFGHVPVELPVAFCAAGILFGGVHHAMTRATRSPDIEPVLRALVLIGLAVYAFRIAGGHDTSMLLATVPLGLWGYEQLKRPQMRSLGLLLALGVAVLDHVLEAWIVGAGNYSYASGFKPETPLTYAMLVLMLLGILERR